MKCLKQEHLRFKWTKCNTRQNDTEEDNVKLSLAPDKLTLIQLFYKETTRLF